MRGTGKLLTKVLKDKIKKLAEIHKNPHPILVNPLMGAFLSKYLVVNNINRGPIIKTNRGSRDIRIEDGITFPMTFLSTKFSKNNMMEVPACS